MENTTSLDAAKGPFRYDHPRRVWSEGCSVFLESHNGATVMMSGEVALHLSRLLADAGSEAIVFKITGS